MNKKERSKLEIGDLIRFDLSYHTNSEPFNWGGVLRNYDFGIVVDKYWCEVEKSDMIKIEWVSDDLDSHWCINDEGDSCDWRSTSLLSSSGVNEQA